MHLEPWQWILAVFAAFLVGVSKTGISGLGMLFVAVFAMVIQGKQSTGVVLPLLIFGDLVAVLAYRRHAQWSYLWKLFPWTGLGVVIGYFALGRINDHDTRVLIGLIVCGMVVLHVWRRWRLGQGKADLAVHSLWFAALVGILAGFTTLVANASGPLMAIYLLAMGLPKMEFMGTGAVFFMLLNWFKVPFMISLGLITWSSIAFDLWLAPAVLAGALFGRWMLPRIDQKLFETLALGLSAAAGIKLLF
ncbi:MAG TPA: sulfite exporter TauE/SafE family protein [Opitutaceae bacterium]|nr:sulfite exporter TauE/SafE family protein [Opitutaceae bacterium]